MIRTSGAIVSLAVLSTTPACKKTSDTSMTAGEAHEAITESATDSSAANLTAASVEISTNFTVGKGIAYGASELQGFIASQLPCAKIGVDGGKLTVTYGGNRGNCTYNGQTFTGQHIVTLVKNDADVQVDHEWKDLSNGVVEVTGTAHVTWDASERTRHVQHDLTWTRLSDGKTGQGSGARTQSSLGGDVAEGIVVQGSRTWTGVSGRWDLAIEGVEMRWVDPVPQSGTYRLASPRGRSLSLTFARADETAIAVTVASGDRSFKSYVNSTGVVSDQPLDANGKPKS